MQIDYDLRAAIRADKRTQLAIAKAAGIAPGNLSAFMHGRRNPSVKSMERLARVLGYTIKIELVLVERLPPRRPRRG